MARKQKTNWVLWAIIIGVAALLIFSYFNNSQTKTCASDQVLCGGGCFDFCDEGPGDCIQEGNVFTYVCAPFPS